MQQQTSKSYPVAINGKTRTEINITLDATQQQIEEIVAGANDVVQKWLEGKQPKKIIYVKNRMINVGIIVSRARFIGQYQSGKPCRFIFLPRDYLSHLLLQKRIIALLPSVPASRASISLPALHAVHCKRSIG